MLHFIQPATQPVGGGGGGGTITVTIQFPVPLSISKPFETSQQNLSALMTLGGVHVSHWLGNVPVQVKHVTSHVGGGAGTHYPVTLIKVEAHA